MLFDRLHDAVTKNDTAIRCLIPLIPAGGPGDKLFPPTYAEGQYAVETRLIDGQERQVVLLDSVPSQANRIEEALLAAVEAGDIQLPVLKVEVGGYGTVTALDAPHRVYDAIFLDSLIDGVPFRQSDVGEYILAARPRNAIALFEYCPTVLIFGGWDSHGGDGGRGNKLPRALVSEIVGLDAQAGKRTAGRRDPLGITLGAGPIYRSADQKERWTLDPDTAEKDDKGNPKLYGKDKDKAKQGKPSAIGHSNIAPSIEEGGVTISGALHTAVLSLPQLRRLRFPHPKTGELSRELDVTCQTVLAALALYGLVKQLEQGYDLRSRCLLIPAEAPRFELLGRTAQAVESLELDADTARETLSEALRRAQALDITWETQPPTLKAQSKLEALVRRSLGLIEADEATEA